MVLPKRRVQCDTCKTVIELKAKDSAQLGAELLAANWAARPIKGRYRHACGLCAPLLIERFDQWCRSERWRPSIAD